jgi:hypothetical protein
MKCKQCNKPIYTKIVLACTCGTFCSKRCQNKYHERQK